MRRRDLLTSAAAITGTFASRAVFSQGNAGQRAAVVIGVNRAGNLPILRAAVSGAEQIGEWLRTQGFEVRLLVDTDSRNVEVAEIFDAIWAFVDRGTVTQLVIYFAGHGFVNNYSEHWLLSKAPNNNPNEAVNLCSRVGTLQGGQEFQMVEFPCETIKGLTIVRKCHFDGAGKRATKSLSALRQRSDPLCLKLRRILPSLTAAVDKKQSQLPTGTARWKGARQNPRHCERQ